MMTAISHFANRLHGARLGGCQRRGTPPLLQPVIIEAGSRRSAVFTVALLDHIAGHSRHPGVLPNHDYRLRGRRLLAVVAGHRDGGNGIQNNAAMRITGRPAAGDGSPI